MSAFVMQPLQVGSWHLLQIPPSGVEKSWVHVEQRQTTMGASFTDSNLVAV
jgi:hypothetical protein